MNKRIVSDSGVAIVKSGRSSDAMFHALDERETWVGVVERALAEKSPAGSVIAPVDVGLVDTALDQFSRSVSWFPTDRQIRAGLALCLADECGLNREQLSLLRLAALFSDLPVLPSQIVAALPALPQYHAVFRSGWSGVPPVTDPNMGDPRVDLENVWAIAGVLAESPWLATPSVEPMQDNIFIEPAAQIIDRAIGVVMVTLATETPDTQISWTDATGDVSDSFLFSRSDAMSLTGTVPLSLPALSLPDILVSFLPTVDCLVRSSPAVAIGLAPIASCSSIAAALRHSAYPSLRIAWIPLDLSTLAWDARTMQAQSDRLPGDSFRSKRTTAGQPGSTKSLGFGPLIAQLGAALRRDGGKVTGRSPSDFAVQGRLWDDGDGNDISQPRSTPASAKAAESAIPHPVDYGSRLALLAIGSPDAAGLLSQQIGITEYACTSFGIETSIHAAVRQTIGAVDADRQGTDLSANRRAAGFLIWQEACNDFDQYSQVVLAPAGHPIQLACDIVQRLRWPSHLSTQVGGPTLARQSRYRHVDNSPLDLSIDANSDSNVPFSLAIGVVVGSSSVVQQQFWSMAWQVQMSAQALSLSRREQAGHSISTIDYLIYPPGSDALGSLVTWRLHFQDGDLALTAKPYTQDECAGLLRSARLLTSPHVSSHLLQRIASIIGGSADESAVHYALLRTSLSESDRVNLYVALEAPWGDPGRLLPWRSCRRPGDPSIARETMLHDILELQSLAE